MTGTALILGGSGRFGRHAAEAFWNRGWRISLFDRATDDLMAAARDADVIVNGWNPPYTRWAQDLPGLTKAVIHAAKASGATVILPGNVYVFGTGAPEVLSERTPHLAENPLGRLRRRMEASYRASGVRTIILRAGDFLDTEPSGNWFDKVIVAGLDKGIVTYPGDPDVPHAWAYLPDFARAAVELADRRHDLPVFTDIPFPGLTLTGRELAHHCQWRLKRPVKLRPMSWYPLRAVSPVWRFAGHLVELRYLWDEPHRLDRTALETWLPDFRPTDPDTSMTRVLAHKIHPDEPVARDPVLAA